MENKETTVYLNSFWRILKRNWIVLFAVAMLAVILVGVLYSVIYYTPVYSSSSQFYVSNISTETFLFSSGQTGGANDMAMYCTDFVKGSDVLEGILDVAGLRSSISKNTLRSMISASASGAIFTVTVSGTDATMNYKIAQAIEVVLPAYTDYFNNQTSTPDFGAESKLLKINDRCVLDKIPDNRSSRYNYPLLAGFLVFVCGCVILVVISSFDRAVYNADDMKEKLPELTLFGEIPHWELAGEKKYRNRAGKKAPPRTNVDIKRIDQKDVPVYILEQFRRLCTNVTFCSDREKGTSIGVVSALAESGKSFVMANLAITLSDLVGKKVLLVDADMRCPMQHRIFQTENKQGLSNLLAGQVDDEASVIHVLRNGALSFIPSGICPPNAMRLFSSSRMKELLKHWEEEYDYILFDLPPIGAVSDALALSKLLTGFIFALRSGMSDSKMVRDCIMQMEAKGGTVLGGVLTDISDVNLKNTYYYYSKYGKDGEEV